jgi:hypothetical protein
MFSHIKEVGRILSYREPKDDACFVFEEKTEPKVSATGYRIASLLIASITIYVAAHLASPIAKGIEHLFPGKAIAMTVLSGGVGALLMWLVDSLRNDFLQSLRTHVRLEERLAPFFGHRLEYVFRVLRGSTHAS